MAVASVTVGRLAVAGVGDSSLVAVASVTVGRLAVATVATVALDARVSSVAPVGIGLDDSSEGCNSERFHESLCVCVLNKQEKF